MVVYLVLAGPDEANQFAAGAGLVVALLALAAPYLLPVAGGAAPMLEPDRAEDTGNARAAAGGQANTGADITGDGGPAQVVRSGDATADGPGSTANTGIVRRPRP
ncbi:hypothetical protein Daura_23635 [Dactylosporangium aurantiacum]|uniref:Uncharacterized protein n=1 Tax=Dactylosporangium aurantiacum TaxID=35754 RepID=A0A9Q9IPK7_9ACTN|nr:hypothetical protein [Dactylosporangium aurantiacum]MDG6103918.1 hypothetical protein [Dactylosporangium aurantiacum]UWZ58893.1 hypothetical protein Daura_23635 [Dactylosporangium aurantiacum]